MEPRREEPKAPTLRPEEKRKRFRLIKLEERIAPGGGHGNGSNDCHGCRAGASGCTGVCSENCLSIE